MKRIFSIVAISVAWVLFAILLVVLVKESSSQKGSLAARSLNIIIHGDEWSHSDGDQRGEVNKNSLLTILSNNKVSIVGSKINSINTNHIEKLLEQSGFVERAECYINREGDVTIEAWRRRAAARLMLNNYNSYLTDEGLLFNAPTGSPILTHVVTGDYRPVFPYNYRGSIDSYVEERIEEIDKKIEVVEMEKYPILKRQRDNIEDRRSLQKKYISRNLFESEDEFAERVADLRASNKKVRSKIAEQAREIQDDLDEVESRVTKLKKEQKKLRKKCEDIYNLIIFVESLNSDPFWRSEIVQIVLSEGSNSNMRIEFMVRSGSFKVVFGELDYDKIYDEDKLWDRLYGLDGQKTIFAGNIRMVRRREVAKVRREREGIASDVVEDRLELLRSLYDDVLRRVGWDRYKEINIEFKDQIVCR